MTISSRTPEGDPNRCPLCGHDLRLEPSWPTSDAPCPHCGNLVWFGKLSRRKQSTAKGLKIYVCFMIAILLCFTLVALEISGFEWAVGSLQLSCVDILFLALMFILLVGKIGRA